MKSYIVAGLHGDEVFGLKVLSNIQQAADPDLMVRVGHPEAIAKRKRFLQADLNRSFKDQGNTLESRIAKSIYCEMKEFNPSYIIDIHTSRSDLSRVAIAARLNLTTAYLAQTLGLEALVVMPADLTSQSLLGCMPNISISAEFGRFQRSDLLAEQIANSISTLGKIPSDFDVVIPCFEVVDTISKDFLGLEDIKNLQFNEILNGYPFLAGPNTYNHIGGFLAKRTKQTNN